MTKEGQVFLLLPFNRLTMCSSVAVLVTIASAILPRAQVTLSWTYHTASHLHLAASPISHRLPLNHTRVAKSMVPRRRLCGCDSSTQLYAHKSRSNDEEYFSDHGEEEEKEHNVVEEEEEYDYMSRLSPDNVELFRHRLLHSNSLDNTPLASYHSSRVVVHFDADDEEDDIDHDDDEEYCDPFVMNSCSEEECDIPSHIKGEASDTVDVFDFLGIKRAEPLERRILRDWE